MQVFEAMEGREGGSREEAKGGVRRRCGHEARRGVRREGGGQEARGGMKGQEAKESGSAQELGEGEG